MQRRNDRKLRHYGNIYRQQRRRRMLLAVGGTVSAVLALALLGWFLYPPVRDLILNAAVEEPASAVEVISEEPASSEPVSAAPESAPVPAAPEPAPEPEAPLHGVYAPAALAADRGAFAQLLKTASEGEADLVLVEAKGSDGIVCFKSENETAAANGTVWSRAYDPAQVVSEIKAAGMRPAARIWAFRDPLLSAERRDLAVLYGNTEARWLDNSLQNGGKSWLNPCSDEVQQYLIDLALELTNAGFEEIVVTGLQFPTGLQIEYANYGVTGFSRSEVLKTFAEKITAQIEAAGGRALINVPADSLTVGKDEKTLAALERTNDLMYGGSPDAFAGKRAFLTLGVSTDQTAIRQYLAQHPDTDWTLFVPSYAMDGTAITATSAVGAFGSDWSYILYHPRGTYLLN